VDSLSLALAAAEGASAATNAVFAGVSVPAAFRALAPEAALALSRRVRSFHFPAVLLLATAVVVLRGERGPWACALLDAGALAALVASLAAWVAFEKACPVALAAAASPEKGVPAAALLRSHRGLRASLALAGLGAGAHAASVAFATMTS
jgi:hypothetical protein